MRYNKDYHSSVVGNFRAAWKKHRPGVELLLTDVEIWNVFDEWSVVPADADTMKAWEGESEYDACVLDVMQEQNMMRLA